MTRPPHDPYVVLGVARDASQPQISSAYRARVRRLHPDTRDIGSDPGAADAALQQTLAAYLVLSDPRTRARYDGQHRDPAGRPQPVPVPVRVTPPPAPAWPRPEPVIRAGPVRWQRDADPGRRSGRESYQDAVMSVLRWTRP